MNVFFHVATAVGLTVALTDTNRIKTVKDSVVPACLGFVSGILVHGIIDYLPHTYPFSAKSDVVISFLMIAIFLFIAKKKYRLILLSSIIGCIFPDLVDLLPPMLNKYLGFHIFVTDKVFLWHTPAYSGSIFTGTSIASDINHIAVLFITIVVCWCRKADFVDIFGKKSRG